MLTSSGNQYLRPEYLSPLPTTGLSYDISRFLPYDKLDAKKSPLALLAQTCSNIGADSPNNKPLLPSLDKSKSSSVLSGGNSSSRDRERNSDRDRGSSGDVTVDSDRSASAGGSSNKGTPHSHSHSAHSPPTMAPLSNPHVTINGIDMSSVVKPPISSGTIITNSSSSSFKPYEATPTVKKEQQDSNDSDGSGKSGFRTPTSKSASASPAATTPSGGKTTPVTSATPSTDSTKSTTTSATTTCGTSSLSSDTVTTASLLTSPLASVHSQHNRISIGCGNMLVEVNHHESTLPKDSLSVGLGLGGSAATPHHHLAGLAAAYKPGQFPLGIPPGLSGLAGCTGCTQVGTGHVPVDAATTSPTFPPGIATQSGSGAGGATTPGVTSSAPGAGSSPLKPGAAFPHGSAAAAAAAAAALNPYVAYARVKTATGGTTLVPVCRDPYCTNCQFNMQSATGLIGLGGAGAPGACPAGCTQCNHEKVAAAAAVGLGVPNPLSPFGLGAGVSPGALGALSAVPGLSQLYSHSMLSAAAASAAAAAAAHRPYVCNWIAGDTYCGKRFGTSEELLQHLRTHTNLSASEAGAAAAASVPNGLPGVSTGSTTALPLFSPSISLPAAAAALGLGCHLHYSTAPSLTTPAGLHRTYPTSLSPVSSLAAAAAANRYHPYKPPPFPPLGASPLGLPPHPGLGAASPYYSPYAMYGQRLGAAVHP